MDWASERYVRLFIRDTVGWKLLPWQSKCLLPLLLRKVYPTGELDLEGEGLPALASIVEIPLDIVQPGFDGLVAGKVAWIDGSKVVVRNFLVAQNTPSSSRIRQVIRREKKLAEDSHTPSRKPRQRDKASRGEALRSAEPPARPDPTRPDPRPDHDQDSGTIHEEESRAPLAAGAARSARRKPTKAQRAAQLARGEVPPSPGGARVLARIGELGGRRSAFCQQLEDLIAAGVEELDLLAVVEFKARDEFFVAKGNLNPVTLFRPTNFPGYLDAARAAGAQGQSREREPVPPGWERW